MYEIAIGAGFGFSSAIGATVTYFKMRAKQKRLIREEVEVVLREYGIIA
ncbi:hypothetical protein ACGF5F_32745 [Streptomyces sp. NPDC047821]